MGLCRGVAIMYFTHLYPSLPHVLGLRVHPDPWPNESPASLVPEVDAEVLPAATRRTQFSASMFRLTMRISKFIA